ncbi:MAG: hypothetical protein WAK18_04665 [Nocardioidaceae bacterium]
MLPRKRNLAMAAGAALVATTALSGAGLAGSADAAPVTHTLKFVAFSDKGHGVGRTGFAGTEIDRNHGKFVGYDLISGTYNPTTQAVQIYIAVTRKGGLLFARVHSTSQTTYVGRVTGGAGRFAGAKGTLTAQNAPHNDKKTFVTIHYTLP